MAAEFLAFLLLAQDLPPLTEAEVREIIALCEAPNNCGDKETVSSPAGGSAPPSGARPGGGSVIEVPGPIIGGSALVPGPAETDRDISADLREGEPIVVAGDAPLERQTAEPRIRDRSGDGDPLSRIRVQRQARSGASRVVIRAPVARAAPPPPLPPPPVVMYAPPSPPPPGASGGSGCMLLADARNLARREVPRLLGREGLQYDGSPIEGSANAHYIGRRSLTESYLISIDFNALPKLPPGTQPCRPQIAAVFVRRVPPNPAVKGQDQISLRLRGQLAAKLDP